MKSWLINFLFISKRHVQVKVLSIGIHVTRNVQATVSKSALLCYMSSMYHERKMSSYILVSQSSVSCQSVHADIIQHVSVGIIYTNSFQYTISQDMLKFQLPWCNLPFIPYAFRENQYETTVTASAWPSKAYEVCKMSQICYCNS